MLDGGIIQRLLEEKWKTFARVSYTKKTFRKKLENFKQLTIPEPIFKASLDFVGAFGISFVSGVFKARRSG